jgi:6-phosphogluconolactonase
MPGIVTVTYQVWPTAEEMALASAKKFATSAQQAAGARGVARIAISGGSTPKAMFKILADPAQPFLASVPWDKLQLYWVDERCVGPDDPESNYGVCRDLLLTKAPIPAANVFRMEGELDPQEAASRYESVLRNNLKLEGAEVPVFDLVTLGMGPDGHTASLFPHTEALHEMGRLVVANHVLQKETWRITLTRPVIDRGREVVFEVEGQEKAEILGEVLTGLRDTERLPAQLIRPVSGNLLFLLDSAAAAKLPPATEANAALGCRVGTLTI